jgi:peptidyl-prolyl cis-trans isomerase A (cyclophilin A)
MPRRFALLTFFIATSFVATSLIATSLFAQKQLPPGPDVSKLPPGLYAVIYTGMGTFTAQLFEKETPDTVLNFEALAQGRRPWLDPKTKKMVLRPFYENLTFHRVLRNLMVQTGDPTATGAHNCGFFIKDEFNAGFKFDRPGRLAMANGGPNTSACQFFITDDVHSEWNGSYTIFGQVVDGQKVVSKLASVLTDNEKPRIPQKLLSIQIIRVAGSVAPQN